MNYISITFKGSATQLARLMAFMITHGVEAWVLSVNIGASPKDKYTVLTTQMTRRLLEHYSGFWMSKKHQEFPLVMSSDDGMFVTLQFGDIIQQTQDVEFNPFSAQE